MGVLHVTTGSSQVSLVIYKGATFLSLCLQLGTVPVTCRLLGQLTRHSREQPEAPGRRSRRDLFNSRTLPRRMGLSSTALCLRVRVLFGKVTVKCSETLVANEFSDVVHGQSREGPLHRCDDSHDLGPSLCPALHVAPVAYEAASASPPF